MNLIKEYMRIPCKPVKFSVRLKLDWIENFKRQVKEIKDKIYEKSRMMK